MVLQVWILRMYNGYIMSSNVTRDHHTFTRSTVKNVSGDLALDIVGDLALSADGGNVTMDDGTTTIFDFNVDEPSLKIMDDADAGDYFEIAVGASGATTLSTTVNGIGFPHLILDSGGAISLDSHSGGIKFNVAGTTFGIAQVDTTSILKLYEQGGASVDDFIEISCATHGASTIRTVDNAATAADLTLDIDGDITAKPAGGNLYIHDGSNNIFNFDAANTFMRIYDDDDTADHFTIGVGATGVVTMTATHTSSLPASSSIRMTVDSYVYLNGGDVIIDTTKKLIFDGSTSGDTYITEDGDLLQFIVGGDQMLNLLEGGANGNSAWFRNACVGFTQAAPTPHADDTEVDFRQSNKQKVTMIGNIDDVHFQFPAMSGNFLCVFLQDGTGGWDVANWKTKDQAGNAGAGNSGAVLWAGGTATTLTETADKADIVSIYWDNDNELAYAVASENF